MQPLPVDAFLPGIQELVRAHRALVVTAPPGAGKTTRVAPALSEDGPTLLLQPRRVAARSIARRIASERGWTLGEEVGWQVRYEHRYTRRTRLLVATEGVLTARAQSDPLLSAFTTAIIDEFHERSLHADLALALSRQAWLARDDFRLVVMSATLDADAVSIYLDRCPIVAVPGRLHDISLHYLPGGSIVEGVRRALDAGPGQVLAFLPGAPEIRRASASLAPTLPPGVELVELHGSLPADQQDAALGDVPGRRVILATNLAETSVTVPGVRGVVDSGLQKVVRFDPSRGIDSLDTERISLDSADQRAGRAGRTAPGVVFRLWDERDRLRPSREPEIDRVDLAGLLLDVLAWGGRPETIDWFTPPSPVRLAAAWRLLERLGAVAGERLTHLGRQVAGLSLPPRLACILVAARGAPEAVAACALLADRFTPRARRPGAEAGPSGVEGATTPSDLLSVADRRASLPPHLERAVAEMERSSAGLRAGGRLRAGAVLSETDFLRAVLAGYPDRVARRREPGSRRVVLASGHGAQLSEESGVRNAEFLVAVDVVAADPVRRGTAIDADPSAAEARIRLASAIEKDWLTPTASRVQHRVEAGVVRAFEQDLYDELVLNERQVEPDPDVAASLLADAWSSRGLSTSERELVNRLRFAGLGADVPTLIRAACAGRASLGSARLEDALDGATRSELDRLAPVRLSVPSGRDVRLSYRDEGTVHAAVKLQELFGLADSPRLGPDRQPVVFELLAPNGRPVQLTRDLRGFWDRTYPEVRRELRGRYPRHPWPEDPWSAQPTSKPLRKPGRG